MGMQPPVRGSPALQPPGGPGAVSSRGMIPVPGVSGMVPVSNGMVPNPQAPSHSMQPSGPGAYGTLECLFAALCTLPFSSHHQPHAMHARLVVQLAPAWCPWGVAAAAAAVETLPL
eukprot:357002-Chlamydomonas_euryale.AAC.12